jgi:hypothetical protein
LVLIRLGIGLFQRINSFQRWVPQVTGRISKFAQHFQAYYVWSDDTASANDLAISVQVDPLTHSSHVKKMDSIRGIVGWCFD